MSFESDLVAALSANAALAALVGDRIVPSHEVAGVSARQYLVYTVIFSEEHYDLDGGTGMSRVRLQLDCYAESFDAVRQIAEAAVAAVPQSGWPLHGNCVNEQDMGLEPGTRLYRRLLEFYLAHRP